MFGKLSTIVAGNMTNRITAGLAALQTLGRQCAGSKSANVLLNYTNCKLAKLHIIAQVHTNKKETAVISSAIAIKLVIV